MTVRELMQWLVENADMTDKVMLSQPTLVHKSVLVFQLDLSLERIEKGCVPGRVFLSCCKWPVLYPHAVREDTGVKA